MTTLTLAYQSINHRIKSLSLPKITWRAIYFWAILFLLFMSLFYVLSINRITQGTYLIKSYNKEINKLLEENKILETKFAQNSYLGNLEDKVKELSFEKTTEIKYVQILENSLGLGNNQERKY